MNNTVENPFAGPSTSEAPTPRGFVESTPSRAESGLRGRTQSTNNGGQLSAECSSSSKDTSELVERWEKARASGTDPEPLRILVEKENKDKAADVYVKLPVEHVIRALEQARSGNASGARVENVMVPAKVSTSIATSYREVYNVATVAPDAVFVNEPPREARFSKEELAQIHRATQGRNANRGSTNPGAHTESGSSAHTTNTRNGQNTTAARSSQGSSSSFGVSTSRIPTGMASLLNPERDAKRPRLMDPKGKRPANDEDAAATNRKFDILTAFFRNAELTLELAQHLDTPEFFSLYAISKDFHETVNNRLTTTILSHAEARFPESASIFPFRCYARLCIKDPAGRPHPVQDRAVAGEVRPVPSFRWLQMVSFREKACRDIIKIMALDGMRLPGYCEFVLKKIWFMMDIPDNRRRVSIIRNPDIWSDLDLFFATMIFIKMDMRFNHPLRGSGGDGLRELVLSQPGLTMLWKALNRTIFRDTMDVTIACIRWNYMPRPYERGATVFGIPPGEVGTLQYEAWGKTGSTVKLYRPDDLVLMESIRRNLHLESSYTNMFLWGIDATGQYDTSSALRQQLASSNAS